MKAENIETVEDLRTYVNRRISKGLSWSLPLKLNYYSRNASVFHKTGANKVIAAINKLKIAQELDSPLRPAFHLATKLKAPPVCEHCKQKETGWHLGSYRVYCSLQCRSNSKKRLERYESTMIDRYGAANASQVAELNQRKKDNCLHKYGVDHHWKVDSVRDTAKETMLERYGVDNASKSEALRTKAQNTWKAKYGTDHPMKNSRIKANTIATNQKRTGYDWGFQNPKIQQKLEKTNLKRYGVRRPVQNTDIHKKAVMSSLRTHSLKIGKILFEGLQGFEPQALRYLIDEDIYAPTQLIVHPSHSFEWVDDNGKSHCYHPDIKVRGKKHIIEVKSEWTLKGTKGFRTSNRAKREAVVAAGYTFSFLIMHPKKSPVWKTYRV